MQNSSRTHMQQNTDAAATGAEAATGQAGCSLLPAVVIESCTAVQLLF
jgi:hypothetical protein